MINYSSVETKRQPWKHFVSENLFTDIEPIIGLSKVLLPSVSDIEKNPEKYNIKRSQKIIGDNFHSCELDISPEIIKKYPEADKLINYFSREGKVWLEQLGKITLPKPVYLRVQLVRDVDGYYIKPHTDALNKLVTFICHLTNTQEGGTQILNQNQEVVYRVGSSKNNALIFYPNYAPYVKTYHSFMESKIEGYRDTLMVNYYSSTETKTQHLWKL
jgi:hypothetical protein